MEPQREWFEKDYYKTLGVAKEADPKDITKAYRKLARQLHPDANPGDSAAEDRFKEVSAAYDVLGDADKRKAYDEVRRLGPMAGGFGAGPGGFNVRFGGPGGPGGDLGEPRRPARRPLRHPAGRRAAFSASGARMSKPTCALTSPTRVKGVTTSVGFVGDAACGRCRGRGSEPGSSPRRCPACDGRGVSDDNQGLFSFSRPCSACAGRGAVIDKPCSTCSGSGAERRPREVRVRIPAGVRDGQRIKLKGRGEPGPPGGRPGDLFVRVRVDPHQLFGRDGDNLTPDRARHLRRGQPLGTDVPVPTLNGSVVTIRIPPGTQTGRVFRVRGRGGSDGADLLVTVEVMIPHRNLSDEQRAAIESLAAATPDNPRSHLEI